MTRRLDDEKKDWMSWMLNKRRESSRNMQPIAEAPARPPGAAQGPPPKLLSSAGLAFVVLLSIPLIVIMSISRSPSYSEDALAPLEAGLASLPYRLSQASGAGKGTEHGKGKGAGGAHAGALASGSSIAHVIPASHVPHHGPEAGPHSAELTDAPVSIADKAAEAVQGLVQGAIQHSVFDFKVLDVAGNEVSLADYAGSVTLIVNVASKCDLTGVNYRELQRLHRQFGPRGFAVLAFPSNQFGGMEPGTDDEIEKFARDKYHATFPLFAKVDVNGKGAHPLFTFLKNAFGIKEIPWNFQKFLCDRTGRPVLQFPSQIDPLAFVKDIEALLDKGKGLLPSRKGQPLLGSLVH